MYLSWILCFYFMFSINWFKEAKRVSANEVVQVWASLSKIWIPWLSYVLSRVQWTANVNLNHCWSVPLPSRNFQNPTPKKIFVWKREEVYILYYMGHLPYSAIFFGKIAKFDWPPPQVSKGLATLTQLVKLRRGKLVLTLPNIRFGRNFYQIISGTKYE